MNELASGSILAGRYRLDRLLGSGGMGTVWVATQIALERQVAIKVLHRAVESQRARLRREALALAAVVHPAVVQVFDFAETADGEPFVVMELVAGESLASKLDRDGAMHARDAVELVLPLLDGLAAAHRAGVVHRDVKPENVLLGRLEGGGVAPKLLDFGIARDARATTLTIGGVAGTPAYMSPEQLRGEDVDERSDVWSSSVVLYELIAGTQPFVADDLLELGRRIQTAPPPYPRSARGLDGPLWSILTNALRKERDARTPSAVALRASLATWLDSRSSFGPTVAVAAPPATASQPATMPPAAPAIDDDTETNLDGLVRAKLDT